MTDPSLPSPTSAPMRTWKRATIVSSAFSAAVTIVYVTILSDATGDVGWMLPRLMQLAVYLSAIAAVACADRFNHEVTRHRNDSHGWRTERRLQSIGNAMVENGIQLDTITGDIPRVIVCPHATVETNGRQLRADGHGLDPAVLDMGDRIARRLHDR